MRWTTPRREEGIGAGQDRNGVGVALSDYNDLAVKWQWLAAIRLLQEFACFFTK